MWICPTVLPPTRSSEWDCAVACVTIESVRERRLEGKRRSDNGYEAETQKKNRKFVPSVPKELVFSFYLLCTNSSIYSMSTEVNSSLQPHNYFPYGAYITTERRRKRGGGSEKDWGSKYVADCTVKKNQTTTTTPPNKKHMQNVASFSKDSPWLIRRTYWKVVHPCTRLYLEVVNKILNTLCLCCLLSGLHFWRTKCFCCWPNLAAEAATPDHCLCYK